MRTTHQQLADAVDREAPPIDIDKILSACPDPECMECARIVCPHGDWLHFHHDGCPACTEHDDHENDRGVDALLILLGVIILGVLYASF